MIYFNLKGKDIEGKYMLLIRAYNGNNKNINGNIIYIDNVYANCAFSHYFTITKNLKRYLSYYEYIIADTKEELEDKASLVKFLKLSPGQRELEDKQESKKRTKEKVYG